MPCGGIRIPVCQYYLMILKFFPINALTYFKGINYIVKLGYLTISMLVLIKR